MCYLEDFTLCDLLKAHQGDSPLAAAVRLLPFIFMVAAFALINGAVMSKTGYYMPWYIFGSVLVLVGSALMCKNHTTYSSRRISANGNQDTVTLETETSKVYGYTVLIGIGIGSVIQAGWSVAEYQAPASETSNIIGFMSIGMSTNIFSFIIILYCHSLTKRNFLYQVKPSASSSSSPRLEQSTTAEPL